MTAIEFLKSKDPHFSLLTDINQSHSLQGWINLMDEYAEQQVKNCLIADVVGSLPSDEDIQREAYIRVECWDKVNDGDEVDGGYDGFIKGCKWIIGKLRQ